MSGRELAAMMTPVGVALDAGAPGDTVRVAIHRETDGEALRRRLVEIGMSQAELARLTGHRPEAVTRWVHGKRPVPAYAWTVLDLSEQISQVRAAVNAAPSRKGGT